VAATLTGIIYQAKLFNRQARVNVPEEEVVVEVISLWRIVTDALIMIRFLSPTPRDCQAFTGSFHPTGLIPREIQDEILDAGSFQSVAPTTFSATRPRRSRM
jgi:hypothetical protein